MAPELCMTCIVGRPSLTFIRVVLRALVLCSISDDRGYLSCRAGMWAGYELSVTRALGHKHLGAYGVLCEPTVTTVTLQPDDACLVSYTVFSHPVFSHPVE